MLVDAIGAIVGALVGLMTFFSTSATTFLL
jgi:hypothetical protein